jgi:hypothetical protein
MEQNPKFQVTDPRYERRVRQSFAGQGLMSHLGAQLAELRPGFCEIRAKYREELTQQHGYFHAGVSPQLPIAPLATLPARSCRRTPRCSRSSTKSIC